MKIRNVIQLFRNSNTPPKVPNSKPFRRQIPLTQMNNLIPFHPVKIEVRKITPENQQGNVSEQTELFHLPEETVLATEKKLFDHVILKPTRGIKPLLSDIRINNPEVLKFIESQIKFSFSATIKKLWYSLLGKNYNFYLIYGNKYDEKGIIRQEGVGLVLLLKKGRETYIVPFDLTPSKPTKLHLEAIFRKEFPQEIITWPSEVSLDKKVWSAIYEKVKEEKVEIPEKQIAKIWPFPLPPDKPVRLVRPTKSFKETLKTYLNACKKEKIIRLEAIGNFISTIGRGFLLGVILYPILDLAQNLKIWALIGFLLEFMPIFSAKVNAQVGKSIDALDAQENFIESQNKRIPLWDLGARFQTLRTLIKNQWKVSAMLSAGSLLNFLIYPPIFQKLWGITTSLLSSAYFVFAYLANELLITGASILEDLNFYKILRHYRKNPELKKDFWTIRTTHANIELVTKQVSFGLGFGLYYLSDFNPTFGIGLAATGLAMSAGKFILPIWGREENSVLRIKGPFTRFGQYLKFSNNLRLWVKPGSKVNVIGNAGQVIIPDPDPEVLKLILADTNYRLRWRRSILPFLRKEKITLKSARSEDPKITFVKYGSPLSFEEFVRYLQLNDFSFLKEVKTKDDQPKT